MKTTYKMTPKRRFLSAILGGRVDRSPVGSVTSVANVEQMEITGAFFPDVHLDGERMAHLAAGAYEILGYDAIMPYFSVQAEAAALGCEMDWGDVENMPVATSHPWSAPDDVQIPGDFLEKPSTRAVLDALQIDRDLQAPKAPGDSSVHSIYSWKPLYFCVTCFPNVTSTGMPGFSSGFGFGTSILMR